MRAPFAGRPHLILRWAFAMLIPDIPLTSSTGVTETILDLRGIRCPHVVLCAKKVLRDIPIGGVLVLECTDPLATIDVPHFVNQTGHALAEQTRSGDLLVFKIEKRR